VRYWRFWESHRLSRGNKDEVLDRLAEYKGLAAKVSPIWVLTMLLSNFLLVAVAVALIVSRGAWLMALVVIIGVVILNILLPTWRSRWRYSGIRNMLQINAPK
jgi:Flp pilus assembly protein TadB